MGWIKSLIPVILLACGALHAELDSLSRLPGKTSAPETVSPGSPLVLKVAITIKSAGKDGATLKKLARDVILLKERDIFSAGRFQESLEALKLCRKFSDISADSRESADGISLSFQLTPFAYIREILIKGEYPLFESDVRNVLTIYSGDVYSDSSLKVQDSLVRGLFRNRGFPDAAVKTDSRLMKDSRDYILTINITRNAYVRLSSLQLQGNGAFSAFRLARKMQAWRDHLLPGSAGRFIEKVLKKDMELLTAFYRNRGYAEVRVAYSLDIDSAQSRAAVKVSIQEGPRYKWNLKGRESIRKRKLKKDIVLFSQGNLNSSGVRKSVRNIRTQYVDAGFQEVRVDAAPQFTGQDSAIKEVSFIIKEGPRTIVREVNINGCSGLSGKDILDQMLTRPPGLFFSGAYNPLVLEEDVLSIEGLYKKRGYLNPAVSYQTTAGDKKGEVSVAVNIREGHRTLISSVAFSGDSREVTAEMEKIAEKRAGMAYSAALIRADANRFSSVLSEKGYPHVKVRTDLEFSEDSTGVKAVFHIEKGAIVTTGNYYFTGNFRTSEKYLKKEVKLQSGRPFSLVEMLKGQRQLQQQDIFRSVIFKPIGLKEKSDTAHLIIELEEKKNRYLNFGGGYDTENGVYAKTKLGNRNLLGANKQGWVAADLNQLDARLTGRADKLGYLLETGITEPRLFHTSVTATFSLFYGQEVEQNLDFGVVRYGASLGFNKRWTRRWLSGINFTYENRTAFGDIAYEIVEDSLYWLEMSQPRNVLLTSPRLVYDSRDSFIRPRRGAYASWILEFSQGMANKFDDYNKYKIELKKYLTPLPPLTLAVMGRFGFVHTRRHDVPVPRDQAFFLGGTNSVRGFGENLLDFNSEKDPVGAFRSLSGSVELRLDVGLNIELAGFFDAGQLTNAMTGVLVTGYRKAAGGGIRYITPIGPIGMLYARKLSRRPGESPGQWHFSLGYTY